VHKGEGGVYSRAAKLLGVPPVIILNDDIAIAWGNCKFFYLIEKG
jgi:hypothetical protein